MLAVPGCHHVMCGLAKFNLQHVPTIFYIDAINAESDKRQVSFLNGQCWDATSHLANPPIQLRFCHQIVQPNQY